MTDDEALRAAVVANPEEDDVRLRYADWLQENGDDDRAEFVRGQCELAKCLDCHGTGSRRNPAGESGITATVFCCTDKRSNLLRRRTGSLLKTNGVKWAPAGLPWTAVYNDTVSYRSANPPLPATVHVTFRRGFVEEVHCYCHKWLQLGPSIIAAEPVAKVVLSNRSPIRPADVNYGPPGFRSDAFYWYRCDYWRGAFDVRNRFDPDDLPPQLFARLRDFAAKRRVINTRRLKWAEYDTAEAAVADLSRAALEWAKSA